ncbi:MAG TPA: hypothetical protein VLL25_16740, partial [Acidimicrobiales bacterium]|nr:hypothetical protein [Acidimicrobiales bacterium]
MGSVYVAAPVRTPLAYWDQPGGHVAGHLLAQTWYVPTVRPVRSQQGGWLQLGLDQRPDGSAGWVGKGDVTLTVTHYRIIVSTGLRKLTLEQDGQPVYQSPVGVG